MSQVHDLVGSIRRRLYGMSIPCKSVDEASAVMALVELLQAAFNEWEQSHPVVINKGDAVAQCGKCQGLGVVSLSRGREHADEPTRSGGTVTPADAVTPTAKAEVVGSRPTPSPTFDREAAAQRVVAVCRESSFYPVSTLVRAIVDAVLDVPSDPQGFATDNPRPEHNDNMVTVGAPSPSLDELRNQWHRTPACHTDCHQSSEAFIMALEAALAAAQAECERLRGELQLVTSPQGSVGAVIAELKQRAEAAERSLRDLASFARGNEVDRMSGDAAVVRDVLYGLWATLARLREPLMDEECGKLFMAYAQAPHDPGSTMRAVVREFLRLRGVQP